MTYHSHLVNPHHINIVIGEHLPDFGTHDEIRRQLSNGLHNATREGKTEAIAMLGALENALLKQAYDAAHTPPHPWSATIINHPEDGPYILYRR